MNYYENTFVVDAQLPDDVIQEEVNKFQAAVSENGGKILHFEEWGNRRLAYEIRKRTQGYYVFMQFSAPVTLIAELERAFRLDESILRYLTILIDEKAIKKDSNEQDEQR